jgi:hypothetical protein
MICLSPLRFFGALQQFLQLFMLKDVGLLPKRINHPLPALIKEFHIPSQDIHTLPITF